MSQDVGGGRPALRSNQPPLTYNMKSIVNKIKTQHCTKPPIIATSQSIPVASG